MKIQILELPGEHAGEYSSAPYAIIVSEVSTENLESVGENVSKLTEAVGVRWTFTTDMEVEL